MYLSNVCSYRYTALEFRQAIAETRDDGTIEKRDQGKYNEKALLPDIITAQHDACHVRSLTLSRVELPRPALTEGRKVSEAFRRSFLQFATKLWWSRRGERHPM